LPSRQVQRRRGDAWLMALTRWHYWPVSGGRAPGPSEAAKSCQAIPAHICLGTYVTSLFGFEELQAGARNPLCSEFSNKRPIMYLKRPKPLTCSIAPGGFPSLVLHIPLIRSPWFTPGCQWHKYGNNRNNYLLESSICNSWLCRPTQDFSPNLAVYSSWQRLNETQYKKYNVPC
jgi:hypothetical protein